MNIYIYISPQHTTTRPRGRLFNGSNSLFSTQQDLVKRAVHAMWLTEFTPARLLQTFCMLDIFCALVNAYPAYIASVLSVFSTGDTRLSLLYIVRVDSPILDNIYNKVSSFQIGHFTFVLILSDLISTIIPCMQLLSGRRRSSF